MRSTALILSFWNARPWFRLFFITTRRKLKPSPSPLAVASRRWNGPWTGRWYLSLFAFMAAHSAKRFCYACQQARHPLLQQFDQRIAQVSRSLRPQLNHRSYFCSTGNAYSHPTGTTLRRWWHYITGTCRRVFKNWEAGPIRPSSTMSPITLSLCSSNLATVSRYVAAFVTLDAHSISCGMCGFFCRLRLSAVDDNQWAMAHLRAVLWNGCHGASYELSGHRRLFVQSQYAEGTCWNCARVPKSIPANAKRYVALACWYTLNRNFTIQLPSIALSGTLEAIIFVCC